MPEPPLTIPRLFSGIERCASTVVDALLPHIDGIHRSWKKLLKEKLHLDPPAVRALLGLNIEAQYKNLQSGDIEAFSEALEAQGKLLQRRGIPMDRTVAAFTLYVEACVPFLSLSPHQLLLDALIQMVSASQYFLVMGYSRQSEEHWNELEQRLIESEKRVRHYSVHLVSIYEQTARSIARDLHDDIGHNLLVLKLYLELINVDLKEGHREHVSQKLDEAVNLIGHAIDGVRRLAFNLGPAILEEAGFVPTLRRYGEQFAERTGIKTRFDIQLSVKLPSIFEVTLYRVMQGALSNVVEHSGAKNVRIGLHTRRGKQVIPIVTMSIEDDGKGFDLQKTLRYPNQAFGLMTMRQRVEMLGGKFRTESRSRSVGAEGPGTTIEVEIPVEAIETP